MSPLTIYSSTKDIHELRFLMMERKHVAVYPLTIYSSTKDVHELRFLRREGNMLLCTLSLSTVLYSSTKDIHEIRFLTMERKHVVLYPLTIYCTVLQKIFTS